MINLGLATYGRSFTLRDRNNHDAGAPIRGPGDAGRFTGEKGFISYYEVLIDNFSSYVHITNNKPSRIDDGIFILRTINLHELMTYVHITNN